MKVLRVIPGLDAAFGGPSESSVNACIATQRAGVDTTVVVPMPADMAAAQPPGLSRLKTEGMQVVALPLLGFPAGQARRWGISTAMTRWLRRNLAQFDIVHAHAAWTFPTIAVLASRADVPKILTPHETLTDFDLRRSSMPGMRLLKHLLRPHYFARYDRIVFSSELERANSCPAAASGDRFAVIFHPVLDDRRRPPLQTSSGSGRARRMLGFLGRFHPKKNLELALEALARLPNDFTLIAAGDGTPNYTRQLKQLATDLGIAAQVHWPGFVQGQAKEDFFAQIDVLLMPSQFECFGMSVAEGLIRGVPAIVSPGVGLAPLITEFACGDVTAPSPEMIAAAASRMLGDGQTWSRCSRQAFAAAEAKLTFAAHGEAQRRCYTAVLRQRQGK